MAHFFQTHQLTVGYNGKPLDGSLDWGHCISRLASARRQDTSNFEIKIATRDPADDRYSHMPLEQFIREAGNRAMKIAQQYDNSAI